MNLEDGAVVSVLINAQGKTNLSEFQTFNLIFIYIHISSYLRYDAKTRSSLKQKGPEWTRNSVNTYNGWFARQWYHRENRAM